VDLKPNSTLQNQLVEVYTNYKLLKDLMSNRYEISNIYLQIW